MWSNRQKMHDADAERARQNLPEPTGLWRVPGAHVAAMGASFGARVAGSLNVRSLIGSNYGTSCPGPLSIFSVCSGFRWTYFRVASN